MKEPNEKVPSWSIWQDYLANTEIELRGNQYLTCQKSVCVKIGSFEVFYKAKFQFTENGFVSYVPNTHCVSDSPA